MEVYENKVKIYLLKDIKSEDVQIEICKIIDTALGKDEQWEAFHNKNEFKNYCFDCLYPIPDDKVYKSGQIYTFTVRTIDAKLAQYLNEFLANEYNSTIKCLTTEIRTIPKKFIEKIYSLTPAVLKDDAGYWKDKLSLKDFEIRLKVNLIKKYNTINNTKIDEDFDLYTSIEFKNKKPCPIKYKNIKLLGDKISLNISDDKIAQDIAYMAIGTGILENNGRGSGFVNYRWL